MAGHKLNSFSAEQHPESFVVGTDLSQIQPTGIPNCEFWVENSETQDWIFPYTLDYIHLRAMMTCFNDFQAVMHKSYDHMTPGGWIELYDGSWDFQCMDGTARGTALEQWANLLYLGGLRAGRDMRRARHYKQYLINAGFVDVDEKVVWCPGSPWPADPKHKEIGWFMMENILGMIDAHGKFLESAGLSPVEIEELCAEARRDARNLGIHWFIPVCVPQLLFDRPRLRLKTAQLTKTSRYTVYGRKPMSLGAPMGN